MNISENTIRYEYTVDGVVMEDGLFARKGDKGDTGATGAQGAQGNTGAQGSTGAQGATGETGATGATGPKGDKGDAGVGISSIVKDSDQADGTRYLVTMSDGSTCYITAPKGPAGNNGSDGATGSQGPKGDTGATGAQGPKGDPGPTGAQGDPGTDGTNGTDGTPAGFGTPTITVTTLPSGQDPTASVTASGPDTEKIFAFAFGIPAGGGGGGSVQSDWEEDDTSALAYIKNKPSSFTPSAHTHTTADVTDFPTLATVATSGDYDDLTGKPTIPAQAQSIASGATGYATGGQVHDYVSEQIGNITTLLEAL